MMTSGEHNPNQSRGLILIVDAEPFRDPPRKIHFHIKDKLQEKLEAYRLVLQSSNDYQEGWIPTGISLDSSLENTPTKCWLHRN